MKHHSIFNPALMDAARLESTLISRQPLADRLTEQLWASGSGESKPAILLVGPRGIGKTHLVSLIANRLQLRNAEQPRFAIARLPEDPWGVQTLFDLLAAILRAIAGTKAEQELRKAVKRDLRDVAALEREALRRVAEARHGLPLLLIIENLDAIAANLKEDSLRRWRSYLNEGAETAILAAAPAVPPAFRRHDAAFLGFFQITPLEPATAEEAAELFQRLAAADPEVDDDFRARLQWPVTRARLQMVYSITRGNYRLLVLLYDFLRHGDPADVVEAFDKIVDQLTPYFQARMQSLSPQQRKIMERLCDLEIPTQVGTIADLCSLTPPAASAQLKELREDALVVAYERGRESLYEIAEPMMRICLDAKRSEPAPIRLLVTLLALCGTSDDLLKVVSSPTTDAITKIYFARAFWSKQQLRGETLPPAPADREEGRRHMEFAVAHERWDWVLSLGGDPELREYALSLVTAPDFSEQSDARFWDVTASLALDSNRIEEALARSRRSFALAPLDFLAARTVRRVHLASGGLADLARHAQQVLLEDLKDRADVSTIRHFAEFDPDTALELYRARYPGRAGDDPLLFTNLALQAHRTEVFADLPPNEYDVLQAVWLLAEAQGQRDPWAFAMSKWREAANAEAKYPIAIAAIMIAFRRDLLSPADRDSLLAFLERLQEDPQLDIPLLPRVTQFVAGNITEDELVLSLPPESRGPLMNHLAHLRKLRPERVHQAG